MNLNTLVSAHGYAGDKQQIIELLPSMVHHGCPLIIVSPIDSHITGVGGHICVHEGLRGYIGQRSLDRQWMQMRALLDFKDASGRPFEWFFMNDSDSICLEAEFPPYLYEDVNCVYSNQVDDFRKPGQSWEGMPPWPLDYHQGMPLIAMQPPYWCSRSAMERMVNVASRIKMCPITPFIDWYMVQLAVAAGLDHKPFKTGASCETVTDLGKRVMSERVGKHGATFIHAIKSGKVMNQMIELYKKRNVRP